MMDHRPMVGTFQLYTIPGLFDWKARAKENLMHLPVSLLQVPKSALYARNEVDSSFLVCCATMGHGQDKDMLPLYVRIFLIIITRSP